MYKSTSQLGYQILMAKTTVRSLVRREYVGQFSVGSYTKDITDDEKSKNNLQPHELTHYNIIDNIKGLHVGILTSAKGKNDPNGPYDKLSSTKLDATFIPEINKISTKAGIDDYGVTIPVKENQKKLLVDDYGNHVPAENKGGQYVGVFQHPRKVTGDMLHKFKKDTSEKTQQYMDTHETQLEKILSKTKMTQIHQIGNDD